MYDRKILTNKSAFIFLSHIFLSDPNFTGKVLLKKQEVAGEFHGENESKQAIELSVVTLDFSYYIPVLPVVVFSRKPNCKLI